MRYKALRPFFIVSEIGEMTALLGFPGQKFSRNEIIFFQIPKTTCRSGAKTKKALCSEACDFCIGLSLTRLYFLWLCANYCGILKAENDLSGRWFSWRRRQSTRKRLFLARQSIRTRAIGLSEHPAKASSVKKSFRLQRQICRNEAQRHPERGTLF